MFTRDDYFKTLGFKSDPFASTNSEYEEYLNEYFIDPPYFASLVGSIDTPKSSIVIAPRGFGKTAQRRKLEKLAEERNDEIIAILYENFPIEGVSKSEEITLDNHLSRIIRSLLIAFLSKLHVDYNYVNDDVYINLDEYDRKVLLNLIEKYLNHITPNDVTQSINSIKGIKGKLYDIWMTTSKPITSIINMILASKKLGAVDLSIDSSKISKKDFSAMENFDLMQNLFSKIGIKTIYILIDRVDENTLTNNDSLASYNIIKPLIRELRLLERRIIVFKFFLWDKLTEHWGSDIRLDRIENFTLIWRKDQIINMINKRLSVLSDNKINSISQVLECDQNTINNILLFSNNSPRDLINILKTIFDLHLNKVVDMHSFPNKATIIEGIDKFCEIKFNEVVTEKNQRSNLKKLKIPTFTISLLSSEIFKENENKIRSIIMPWTRSGIVFTLPNRVKISKTKKPVNLYTFNDLRIARHVCINKKLDEFISSNIVECSECNRVYIFDKNNKYGTKEFDCPNCSTTIPVST